MINRYTADRKIRSDDAYTPNNIGGKRPDRASIVYSQRCKEAYPDVPIILGVLKPHYAVLLILTIGKNKYGARF